MGETIELTMARVPATDGRGVASEATSVRPPPVGPRVWRLHGATLQEAARGAGISLSLSQQVERGKADVSLHPTGATRIDLRRDLSGW